MSNLFLIGVQQEYQIWICLNGFWEMDTNVITKSIQKYPDVLTFRMMLLRNIWVSLWGPLTIALHDEQVYWERSYNQWNLT